MSNTDLGLIIWGCKGGYRIFCSNNVVDYKEESIAHTYKDIRAEYNFHFTQINLTTYALEFTDAYKVYTIFRSSNDNGTGAYVAITIYVPRHLRVQALRTLLDRMMDEYFKEYVHPVFGTYYSGKYDDIEPYARLLQSAEVMPELTYYAYQPSSLNRQLHLVLYDDIRELDAYFDSPYRREFQACQEVMFMSREIYDMKPEPVSFIAQKTLIGHVSEPELLPPLFVGDNPDVLSMTINGKEVDKSAKHPINKDQDKICIVLHRDYHEDIILKGTANELKQNRKLKEQARVLSIFPQPFRPKEYHLTFRINGETARDNCLSIQQQGSPKTPQKIIGGTYVIKGNELSRTWEISLAPYPYLTNKDDVSFLVKNIVPKEYVDGGNLMVEVDVAFYEFQVVFDRDVRFSRFYVSIGKQKNKISLPMPAKSGQKYQLCLPQSMNEPELQFSMDADGLTCRFDASQHVLTVESKVVPYGLQVPEDIRSLVKDWDFQIKGVSKRNPSPKTSNDFELNLSREESIKDGELTINGEKFDFEVRGSNVIPKLIHIIGTRFSQSDNNTNWVEPKINPYYAKEDIEKVLVELEHEFEGCHIDSYSQSCPIITLSVRPQKVSKNELAVTEEFMLRLIGCRGFRLHKKGSILVEEDNFSIKFRSDCIPLYYKGKLMCSVYKDQGNYDPHQEKINQKKGFDITYSERECIVAYHKSSFSWIEFLKSKYCRISLAILAVIVALAGAEWVGWKIWNLCFVQEKSFKVASVTFSFDADYGDKLDTVILKDSHLQVDTICDNYFKVDVFWDKEAKVGDILRSNIVVKYTNPKDDEPEKLRLYNEEVESFFRELSADMEEKDFDFENFVPEDFSLAIKSPSQKTIEHLIEKIKELTGDDAKSLINSAFEYALEALGEVKDNSTAEGLILKEMQGIIGNLDDKDKPNAHKKFIERFSDYKKCDVYNEIHLNAIRDSAEEYKKQLRSLSCTPTIVETVENWYRESLTDDEQKIAKEVYDFTVALRLLESFFKTKQMDSMIKLLEYPSWFGEEQYQVIKGLCRDSESFKELKGKSFEEAYRICETWFQD